MDVDIVAEAIREAEAATIAPRFRALTDDDVAFKGPDDPVTIADRACEAMLGASLRMIDDLPVVGEEAAAADPSLLGATDHDAWIVDPLDGSSDYGYSPHWSVHVALVVDGEPTVGAVAVPGWETTWGTDPAPHRVPAGVESGEAPRIVVSRSRSRFDGSRLQAALGEAIKAERTLRRAIRLDPDRPEAYEALVELLRANKREVSATAVEREWSRRQAQAAREEER